MSKYSDAYLEDPKTGLSLDFSRSRLDADFIAKMAPLSERALTAIRELEEGAIANPDEQRQVGHYWLRAADLAPTPEIAEVIRSTRTRITDFVTRVHSKQLKPPQAEQFTHLLSIGIGGSALGPQFISEALFSQEHPLTVDFFDNTDPEGFAAVLARIGERLSQTLVVVISKSGGTPETLNGMKVAQKAWRDAGLEFAKQAVAITGVGSRLDKVAKEEGWLERFPMWDWVGGRTSVTSAVGLVPLALQGIDVDQLLEGCAEMDVLTRQENDNPALLLALAWFRAGNGRGEKAMVVLPYRDRLALFARYLQQLVMESLGKEFDRDGRLVYQGLTVYGNKGSTDQHAYVQQLREGVNDFFATFVVSWEDGEDLEVEPGVTSGDYLRSFWQGTRQALEGNERESLTIAVPRVDARTIGHLIALYERAVGLYAELVGINAYHQPGVEAGKKAAAAVLKLQARLLEILGQGGSHTAAELASQTGSSEASVFAVCRHLAANQRLQAEGQGLARRFSKS